MNSTSRTEIAEPTEVEEVFGGRYDGSFKVQATCPGCGEAVTHLMDYDEFGPSHRVCNAMCGGSYETVRPAPTGLLEVPTRWWEDRVQLLALENLGFNLTSSFGDVPPGPGVLGEVV